MDPDVVWLSISPSGEEFYQFFIIAHHFFIDITVCNSSALCRSLSLRITFSLIQALQTVLAVKIMYATMIVFFTDHRQLVSVSTKQDSCHHSF